VKEVGTPGQDWFLQERPAAMGGEFFAPGADEAIWPIAKPEGCVRMRRRQAEQDLAGISANAGERISDAISGVESDVGWLRHVGPL